MGVTLTEKAFHRNGYLFKHKPPGKAAGSYSAKAAPAFTGQCLVKDTPGEEQQRAAKGQEIRKFVL